MNGLVWWRRAVLADPDLPHTAARVAMTLHEFMTWTGPNAGGNCYPPLDRIAACSGLSRSTVQRALDDLERHAWIRRRRGGGRGRPTRYQAVLVPENRDLVSPIYTPKQGHNYDPVSESDGQPADDVNRVKSDDKQGQIGRKQGHSYDPLPSNRPTNRPTAASSRSPTGDPDLNDNDFHVDGSGQQQPPIEDEDRPWAHEDEDSEPPVERSASVEDIDPVEMLRYGHERGRITHPAQLGRYVAALLDAGYDIAEEQFRDVVGELFGFEDEQQAWAGFHQAGGRFASSGDGLADVMRAAGFTDAGITVERDRRRKGSL